MYYHRYMYTCRPTSRVHFICQLHVMYIHVNITLGSSTWPMYMYMYIDCHEGYMVCCDNTGHVQLIVRVQRLSPWQHASIYPSYMYVSLLLYYTYILYTVSVM